jgi:DNA (cytosine-5)-methyltransferase 1
VKVTDGQPVGLLWASPDCKHFSKAKGGQPVSKKIRSLAWVVCKWAKAVRPRVICLENVEEFQTWGPLGADNRPCPERKGKTFKRWVSSLQGMGYSVEWRELRACDFGAPTIRRRLFLVARCDGQPIAWPEASHAAPSTLPAKAKKLKPWRTAAECIDWSITAPSIFERKKPLAEATCRRIAKGIMRYVVEAADPFIVPMRGTSPSHTSAHSLHAPLSTITGGGTHHGLVVPTLIQVGYGERPGQSPRVPGLDKPMGTLVGSHKHALVSAFLAKHYTGVVGSDMADPVATVTSVDHHSLVTANLIHLGHGEGKAGGKRFSHGIRDVTDPLNTVTASGAAAGLVTATMVTIDNQSSNGGHTAITEPLKTTVTENRHALVKAFLVAYYGVDQDPGLREPMHTVTTRDRFGLVTIHGTEYAIVDIGLRMLTPRELYRAQGFPESYAIDFGADGHPLTKTAQVRMCGNSVCPPMSKAIVGVNYAEPGAMREAA